MNIPEARLTSLSECTSGRVPGTVFNGRPSVACNTPFGMKHDLHLGSTAVFLQLICSGPALGACLGDCGHFSEPFFGSSFSSARDLLAMFASGRIRTARPSPAPMVTDFTDLRRSVNPADVPAEAPQHGSGYCLDPGAPRWYPGGITCLTLLV